MTDLILLILEDGNVIRCTDLNDARSKAILIKDGRIVVEITPKGIGGPMATLEFDRDTQDWVPAR